MNFGRIVVFLYLLVGLVDYFGATDKVVTQTLYLNCLNLISLIVIYKQNRFRKSLEVFKDTFKNPSVYLLYVFFLWSCLTVFKSINIGESFKALTEIFTVLVSFVIILFFLSKEINREKIILQLLLMMLFLELITVYAPYLKDIYLLGEPVERSLLYRGITGSVNVVSYTMLMKLPLIFYYTVVKNQHKTFYIILSVLIMYAIIGILETRSAILSLVVVIVLCSWGVFILV